MYDVILDGDASQINKTPTYKINEITKLFWLNVKETTWKDRRKIFLPLQYNYPFLSLRGQDVERIQYLSFLFSFVDIVKTELYT